MVLILFHWHIMKEKKRMGCFWFNDFFRQKVQNTLDDWEETL